MRHVVYLIPLIAVLGCARPQERRETQQPTAQAARTPGQPQATTPAEAQPQAQRVCSADDDCGDRQLCVHMSCTDITPDMAECASVRVQFAAEADTIQSEDLRRLDRVARCLKADQSVHVVIEGAAKERTAREINVELGDRRATAVANYLASKGVADAQLKNVTYGMERPLCVENDQECLAKHRPAAARKAKEAATKRPKQM
jgi:outer membrane protein OmpA-like peptidoglycan-associated protein